MMDNPVLKMWPPMEEVTAGLLSRMIQRTQERIENHFFEARKHVLEYDDVLNAQREHIYGLRREILLGKDVRAELKMYLGDLMRDAVENAYMIEEDETKVFDHQVLFEDLNEVFPLVDFTTVAELQNFSPNQELVDFLKEKAEQAYEAKALEVGDETMPQLEKFALLRAVNDRWMEHLQTVEYIREGIGLRGYGQIDPLVAYKRETYDTFQTTLKNIRDDAVRMLFHLRAPQPMPRMTMDELPVPAMLNLDDLPPELQEQHGMTTHPAGAPGSGSAATAPGATAVAISPGAAVVPSSVDWAKVGRNDPCPCGSGKKFKSCHYPQLREEGVI